MKAQISYEYYFSLVLFLIFILYVIFHVISTVPSYTREIKSQLLMSEAYQISELLINDPGEPANWDGEVRRIGLSSEVKNVTNLISSAKINRLKDLCSTNYDSVIAKLGIDPKYQLNISIVDLTSNTVLADCSPPVLMSGGTVAKVERISATDTGSYVEITVSLW